MKPILYDCKKCGTFYQTKGEAKRCKHQAWIPLPKLKTKKLIKFENQTKHLNNINT